MNYEKKYLKYKNKYLELRSNSNVLTNSLVNQLGGNNYYLPCEITHITKNVSYNSKSECTSIVKDISILDTMKEEGPIDTGFSQDPYIQLYNKDTYFNIFNSSVYKAIEADTIYFPEPYSYETDKSTITFKSTNDGLNVIETAKDGKVRAIRIYTNYLKKVPSDKYTVIKGKSIHWFSLDTNTQISYPNSNSSNDMYLIQVKGGNFISSPDNKIFAITNIPTELVSLIKEKTGEDIIMLECSFMETSKGNSDSIIKGRHIDELMCFMPSDNKDIMKSYKVWFYDFPDEYKNSSSDKYKYELERIRNLNLVSIKLFGSEYENNKDRFFLSKIRLDGSSLTNPPIFNRVWIELSNKIYCYFPDDEFKYNEKSIELNGEIDKLKIYAKSIGKEIEIKFINTSCIHKKGGNLHCFIKQRLSL